MPKVFLIEEWCKGCGFCVEICPKGVFTQNSDKKVILKFPEKCNGCLLCELQCPDLAITVTGFPQKATDETRSVHRAKRDDH